MVLRCSYGTYIGCHQCQYILHYTRFQLRIANFIWKVIFTHYKLCTNKRHGHSLDLHHTCTHAHIHMHSHSTHTHAVRSHTPIIYAHLQNMFSHIFDTFVEAVVWMI